MRKSPNYPATAIWILALGLFCNDLNAQRRGGGPAPRPSGGLSSVTGGIVGQNEHLSRNRRSLRFSFGDRGDAGKAVEARHVDRVRVCTAIAHATLRATVNPGNETTCDWVSRSGSPVLRTLHPQRNVHAGVQE